MSLDSQNKNDARGEGHGARGGTTVYFSGGGSGGHIYPNLAVADELCKREPGVKVHFFVSEREIDREVMDRTGYAYTRLPVMPLTKHPLKIGGFLKAWIKSMKLCQARYREDDRVIVVTTGGFVSGPAIACAYKGRNRGRSERVLVNLDAVPGVANLAQYKKSTQTFTVYPIDRWRGTEMITLPMAGAPPIRPNKEKAKEQICLDPKLKTLLITGGSQGAESINRAILELIGDEQVRQAFEGWQILHIPGPKNYPETHARYEGLRPEVFERYVETRSMYEGTGLKVKVVPFFPEMYRAWIASDLAITRAGAGTVAEAERYGVPTIYLPYPYHRDDHQRLNAEPLVKRGGGILLRDEKSAELNARALKPILMELLRDEGRLMQMRERLSEPVAVDGMARVSAYLRELLGEGQSKSIVGS